LPPPRLAQANRVNVDAADQNAEAIYGKPSKCIIETIIRHKAADYSATARTNYHAPYAPTLMIAYDFTETATHYFATLRGNEPDSAVEFINGSRIFRRALTNVDVVIVADVQSVGKREAQLNSLSSDVRGHNRHRSEYGVCVCGSGADVQVEVTTAQSKDGIPTLKQQVEVRRCGRHARVVIFGCCAFPKAYRMTAWKSEMMMITNAWHLAQLSGVSRL